MKFSTISESDGDTCLSMTTWSSVVASVLIDKALLLSLSNSSFFCFFKLGVNWTDDGKKWFLPYGDPGGSEHCVLGEA